MIRNLIRTLSCQSWHQHLPGQTKLHDGPHGVRNTRDGLLLPRGGTHFGAPTLPRIRIQNPPRAPGSSALSTLPLRLELAGKGEERRAVMSSSAPSPRRNREKLKEKPRAFDADTKARCWANADVVPGRHPDRWRKDPAGNVVCKRFYNCLGCLCYEYDHIVPFAKGGESTTENCQILQTRVNRLKSDKDGLDKRELAAFSCDVKFTDRELDVIEMAVYGDVIRPGNQCRCRTVAEMLGQYKSKNPVAPCELPYKETTS